jgi:hypothetical protein
MRSRDRISILDQIRLTFILQRDPEAVAGGWDTAEGDVETVILAVGLERRADWINASF